MVAHMAPAIRLDHVTKYFGSGSLSPLAQLRPRFDRVVLRDVSFDVEPGTILGLLGENGSGKTTILKMIASLTFPTAGAIEVLGVDVVKDARRVRSMLGLGIADDRSFYYRLTARANLEFFGSLAGLRGKALQHRIGGCAEMFGLHRDLDRLYGSFSTGMRHRLALARALLSDAPILVLDEPTRAIDPEHADEIRKLIRDTLVGDMRKTAVVATNSLQEVAEMCDRVAEIHEGIVAGTRPAASIAARSFAIASGQ